MIFDLRKDAASIRKYIESRVTAQSTRGDAIIQVVFGYQVSQGGILLVHFDTRPQILQDGHWTLELSKGHNLDLPHWVTAAEEVEMRGGSFLLPTSEQRKVPAGSLDKISRAFGESILTIALDALARGMFQSLPLRSECELLVADFDGYWDNGANQVIQKLTSTRSNN